MIVSGGSDGAVRTWDLTTGQSVGEPVTGHIINVYVGMQMIGYTSRINVLAPAELDGRQVLVTGGSDGAVRIWDVVTGQQVGESLTGHVADVKALAVGQRDGRPVIVSGDEDGVVWIWDLNTGKLIQSIKLDVEIVVLALHEDYIFVGHRLGLTVLQP